MLELNDGALTPVDAAKAKWWVTELQGRVLDTCVQLHGGHGYMREYPVARAWADSRALERDRLSGPATLHLHWYLPTNGDSRDIVGSGDRSRAGG